MSKIKNGGLDQYGAEPFEQQKFGTAGVKGVKQPRTDIATDMTIDEAILQISTQCTVLLY